MGSSARITAGLQGSDRLCKGSVPSEISSLFMRGLPRIVEERLRERLRIKYVDHYASDPYSLEQMFTELTWLYDGG